MVDLVKIRKKAKEQKATEPEKLTGTPGGTQDGKTEDPGARSSARPTPGKRSSTKQPKTRSGKGSKKKKADRGGDQKAEGPKAHEPKRPAGGGSEAAGDVSTERAQDESRSATAAENKLSQFKRTAGVMQEQDSGTSENDEQATVDGQLELITFNLAGEQYAIEVDRLVEIIVPRPWTRVPNAEESVIGIISLRGTIVTLIDLRNLLGHPGRGLETEETRIIVVQGEGEQVGFIVDRVLRVLKVDETAIEPHPVVSSSEQHDAVKGVFLSGETITIYLDLERISA